MGLFRGEAVCRTKQNLNPIIPSISIILCTYNDGSFLAEAIESILVQTLSDFEFIIINDGSTDNTKEVINSYSDKRIKYLEHKNNLGLEEAKNLGLKKAKGKYIAYMDGDDISLPNRLETQFIFLEAHPDIGICGSAINNFGDKKGVYLPPENDREIRIEALFGTPLPHPTCMIRNEILQKNSIRYSTKFPAAEDHPFMLEILKITKAHCLQTPLLLYRWHKQKVSLKKEKLQNENSAKAGRLAFQVLLNLEITEEERQLFKKLYWQKIQFKEVEKLKILLEKINPKSAKSKSEIAFQKYVKQKGFEKLSSKYHQEVYLGISTFNHFVKSKIWQKLPFTFFRKYFMLLIKSAFFSIKNSSFKTSQLDE